ncbi:MAG: hypothetical protein AAGD06_22955 [Acidobacteriota bacterium]
MSGRILVRSERRISEERGDERWSLSECDGDVDGGVGNPQAKKTGEGLGRQLFSSHVGDLVARGFATDEAMGMVWGALRRALRRELRRRGLWSCSPRFLGIVGHTSWQTAMMDCPGGSGVACRDGLDELVADCYVYVFVDRLRSLDAQRKLKPNIEGLVWRNVRFFVHDRQRQHDRLGARIYKILRRAVDGACSENRLYKLSGDGKVGSGSVLACRPAPVAFGKGEASFGRGVLATLAEDWSDRLLPDLVTARGVEEDALVAAVVDLLGTLGECGVTAFRFEDLAGPLKSAVRERWAGRWGASGGGDVDLGTGGLETSAALDPGHLEVESRDRFQDLAKRVESTLGALPVKRRRTRRQLLVLWGYLASYALGETPTPQGGGSGGEGIPSFRELSKQLGIPRDRFPGLIETVKETLVVCRSEG